MWNKVECCLPELQQPVVCINVDRYENTGGDWDRIVQDCVYLSELHGNKYWSKCGERAICLDYYTHWMPLPAPPTADNVEGANFQHTTAKVQH